MCLFALGNDSSNDRLADATLSGGPSRADAPKMFDRIAPRYDLLNHLLSFNFDKAWRRKLTGCLPPGKDLLLLDLATGTGDQLLALHASGKIGSGLGVDPSEGMLKIAREKIERAGLAGLVRVETGRAEKIESADETFDLVTISFGIRNVVDLDRSFSEILRVLKPGGQVMILEFSLPRSKILKALYLLYFRKVLPILGGMISGDNHAYRYLNQTVETFPYGEEFVRRLRLAGFAEVTIKELTFGVASIYLATKESK